MIDYSTLSLLQSINVHGLVFCAQPTSVWAVGRILSEPTALSSRFSSTCTQDRLHARSHALVIRMQVMCAKSAPKEKAYNLGLCVADGAYACRHRLTSSFRFGTTTSSRRRTSTAAETFASPVMQIEPLPVVSQKAEISAMTDAIADARACTKIVAVTPDLPPHIGTHAHVCATIAGECCRECCWPHCMLCTSVRNCP